MTISNRRDFLKQAAIAGAATGAGFLPRRSFARGKQGNTIAYRTLGSTGVKVTEVGFGAMNMRDPELVQAGLDAGINYFDTAHEYMNGVNESTVGKVLKTGAGQGIYHYQSSSGPSERNDAHDGNISQAASNRPR